ncbi:hypothetical protein F5884DRAFT_759439, partial [Xylogone sp. PMI_703]
MVHHRHRSSKHCNCLWQCILLLCTTATSTATSTVTGIAALPSCGQTCSNNMLAQYSALGCASPDPRCLCKNANFGFGLRDCSNG